MGDSARTKPDAMSVSAFARMIERAVGRAFPQKITVRGEVSGARHRTHFYFNLKDDDAVIGAVMKAMRIDLMALLAAFSRTWDRHAKAQTTAGTQPDEDWLWER